MKRLRLDETVQEGGGGPAPPAANPAGGGGLYRPSLPNAAAAIAYSGGPIKVVPGGGGDAMQYVPPAGYGAMPAAPAKPQQQQPAQPPQRGKPASPPPLPLAPPQQQQSPGSSSSSNFQRLKVEDALSYLDSVKYKFGDKPQVYNDFLDIMKEFKNQSIDTPGVIQRVSNLFNGFPDLIDGFNTFLPPGYKIDVQKSDRGYAFQVSVSVPRTAGGGALVSSEPVQKTSMILTGSGIIHGNVAAAPPAPPPPPPPPVLQQHVAAAYGNVAAALQQQQQAVAAVPQQQPPQQHHLGLAAVQQQHHHHHHHHHQQQQQHNSALQFSAAQAAVNQALQGGHGEAPQNQPVEFNHAINYVNKIKNRFQGQPEKYKRFLEILHTYQKEQRTLKESSSQQQQGPPPPAPGKHLTEQEVYSQVAKLFENQSDLLAEFGQFLPDATSHIGAAAPAPPAAAPDHHQPPGAGAKKQGAAPLKPYGERPPAQPAVVAPQQKQPAAAAAPLKRSPPYPNLLARDGPPPPKKHRLSTSCRDVTIAEAGKYCTLNDYAFFDKVRKAVRSQDVYNNFLRCLVIFNQEVVSRGELVQLVAPFLSRQPELLRWFRDFVGGQQPSDSASSAAAPSEPVPYAASQQRCAPDRPPDIDYSTAKRLGTSYCVIPPSQEGLRFSGRTQLCRDVLNNQWVSFPSWAEDNSFVGSRKNQYEEYMYRCEDERFELDVVIETNASAIRVLEGVAKRLARMAPDDAARYRLDDCLGGESPVLHQRALRRIYGEKAQDIVDGLKRSPAVAVPVVLRRLRAKEEEWREAQKGFNKVWRDQNEKYYLKSLDYQGINFKQNDVKALRSKNLFNEIETLFEERNEQNDEGAGKPIVGPHLVFHYRDRTILDDAANLLIHHVKRQTGIQKGEKRRIKHILRQFVPDLFFHPRQQPSDDERDEDDDEKEDGDESPRGGAPAAGGERRGSPAKSPAGPEAPRSSPDVKDEHQPLHAQTNDPDEAYTLFMASNNWYLFLRLHATLCERLARIYERAVALAAAEQRERGGRRESTAVALRLKPRPPIEAEDYYPAFLDMVKNLLDGNMEPSTYEDTLREMFGIHAYPAFTLDKVVSYAVRQLQHCVTERAAVAAADAFARERRRGAAGGACGTAHRRRRSELAYERAAERHHHHDENCFRVYVYRRDCRLTIEMVDADGRGGGGEEVKPDGGGGKRWGRTERARRRLPLYLERNLRGYRVGGGVGQARPVAGRRLEPMEELEKKLNERLPAERGGGGGGAGPCGLDAVSMEVAYTADKGSVLYKYGAFARAKETHAAVTRRLAARFRAWLRRWLAAHVTDAQLDRCTEWLMGRGDDAVANRTRVEPCGDATRAPYAPYNRYRVERLPQQQQRDPT